MGRPKVVVAAATGEGTSEVGMTRFQGNSEVPELAVVVFRRYRDLLGLGKSGTTLPTNLPLYRHLTVVPCLLACLSSDTSDHLQMQPPLRPLLIPIFPPGLNLQTSQSLQPLLLVSPLTQSL